MDLLIEYDKLVLKDAVVGLLREIQKMYKKVLNLSPQEREETVLHGLLVCVKNNPEFEHVKKAIEEVLAEGPEEEEWPYHATYMRKLRKKLPSYEDIPMDWFDQTKMLFQFTAVSIDVLFAKIYPLLTDKRDIAVIDRLKYMCHGTFTRDPNFKSGFYRDHIDYFRPKSSEGYLDENFEAYIEYFQEVLAEEEVVAK